MVTIDSSRVNLPYFAQTSGAALFRREGSSGTNLTCTSGCGQVLVENYVEECFVNVGMKCFRCGAINWTPGLMDGEILPQPVVSLGDLGQLNVGHTVIQRGDVVITCDQELQRMMKLTAPRTPDSGFSLTEEGLVILANTYDEMTGGVLALQRKQVLSSKKDSMLSYPFAWALMHAETCNANSLFDIDRYETAQALYWLYNFSHVVRAWQHHPRFALIAKGFGVPKMFIHTTSQLMLAHYLYANNHRIGFSLEENVGKPNPDLYIRSDGTSKVFIEVKAPVALQWNGEMQIDLARVEKTVVDSVKRSAEQINRSNRGALVIASSLLSRQTSAVLERAIQRALRSRGRNQRGLAAVIGMAPTQMSVKKNATGNDSRFTCELGFSPALNQHYDGANPFDGTSRRDHVTDLGPSLY